jgi:hypothetical protein
MSSESVCQVACSWVDVGGFHMCLFILFVICTASVWTILDIPSYKPVISVNKTNQLIFEMELSYP